jgi:tetratricopeptide (TPR) repeat protein
MLFQDEQLTAARPFCERALAINEQKLGPGHQHTAHTLLLLAMLLERQGDAEAASVMERALSSCEVAFGSDNLQTASCLTHLISLHHELGNYERAQPFLERAFRLIETENEVTVSTLNGLANIALRQGNIDQAKSLIDRLLLLVKRDCEDNNAFPHELAAEWAPRDRPLQRGARNWGTCACGTGRHSGDR